MVEQPERIWIWFADNGNIRKWQSSAFDEGTAFVRADIYDALVKERNNLRGALTARAKTMLRLRAALTQVHDHIEDEGDRCYFGSTNDADTLKEVWQELDGWAWDAVMSDGKLPDVYEASRKAHERAEKAEAERDALAADKAELLAALQQIQDDAAEGVHAWWDGRPGQRHGAKDALDMGIIYLTP